MEQFQQLFFLWQVVLLVVLDKAAAGELAELFTETNLFLLMHLLLLARAVLVLMEVITVLLAMLLVVLE
jgi:hypothetical protein